jgi:hypothetical protein
MAKTDNLKPFQPGQSGNPAGRKPGSRGKLSEAFLAALCEDFAEHGRETIERVRNEKPDAYLKVIASILPKQIDVTTDPFDGMSDDELVTMIRASEAAIREFMASDDENDQDAEERLQ